MLDTLRAVFKKSGGVLPADEAARHLLCTIPTAQRYMLLLAHQGEVDTYRKARRLHICKKGQAPKRPTKPKREPKRRQSREAQIAALRAALAVRDYLETSDVVSLLDCCPKIARECMHLLSGAGHAKIYKRRGLGLRVYRADAKTGRPAQNKPRGHVGTVLALIKEKPLRIAECHRLLPDVNPETVSSAFRRLAARGEIRKIENHHYEAVTSCS